MRNKKTKILFFLIIFFCLLFETGLIIAKDTGGLEIKYPTTSSGIVPPKQIQTFLPRYIRYIYHFSIISGGLIAFLALIYGGFRFMTSAGNPSATADAREQILAGFLGLIIILGSWIILNEINPDLTSMQPPLPSYALRKGIIVYKDTRNSPAICGGLSNKVASYQELVEVPDGVYYKALESSGETILGTEENGNDILPDSLIAFSSSKTLRIEYYGDSTCEDDPLGNLEEPFKAGECLPINKNNVKCIKLIRTTPGVWVFNKLDNDKAPNPLDLPMGWSEGKDYAIFQISQTALDNARFHDKVRAIALVADKELEINYGVVLHNIPGDLMKNKGWARIYLPGNSSFGSNQKCTYDSDNAITRCGPFTRGDLESASSLTIFTVPKEGTEAAHSIRICREDRCIKKRIGDDLHDADMWLSPNSGLDNITSKFGSAADFMGSEVLFYKNLAEAGNPTEWPDTKEVIDHDYGSTGVSSIEIEQGANYLVLLYSEPVDDITKINTEESYIEAAILNQSASSLKTIDWDDMTAMIIVINTLSGSEY